jgi:hypothetical protein
MDKKENLEILCRICNLAEYNRIVDVALHLLEKQDQKFIFDLCHRKQKTHLQAKMSLLAS